jgi:hypothetical protein
MILGTDALERVSYWFMDMFKTALNCHWTSAFYSAFFWNEIRSRNAFSVDIRSGMLQKNSCSPTCDMIMSIENKR